MGGKVDVSEKIIPKEGTIVPWIRPAIDQLVGQIGSFEEASLDNAIREMLGNPTFEEEHTISTREGFQVLLTRFITTLNERIFSLEPSKRENALSEMLLLDNGEFVQVLMVFVKTKIWGRLRSGKELRKQAYDPGFVGNGPAHEIAEQMTSSESSQEALDDFVRMQLPTIIREIDEIRASSRQRLTEFATRTKAPKAGELLE